MATRIILQDDNKFGLYSTVSDRIWAFDLTEDEMIEAWKERAALLAEQEMKEWIADVTGKGRRPYLKQEALTFKQALKQHRFHNVNFAERNPEYTSEVELDNELKEIKKK